MNKLPRFVGVKVLVKAPVTAGIAAFTNGLRAVVAAVVTAGVRAPVAAVVAAVVAGVNAPVAVVKVVGVVITGAPVNKPVVAPPAAASAANFWATDSAVIPPAAPVRTPLPPVRLVKVGTAAPVAKALARDVAPAVPSNWFWRRPTSPWH